MTPADIRKMADDMEGYRPHDRPSPELLRAFADVVEGVYQGVGQAPKLLRGAIARLEALKP